MLVMDREKISQIIKQLILALGEDVGRENLRDTPGRVARAYEEILSGYNRSLSNEITIFKNSHNYKDIVYSGKISFFSTCEHHLLPFFGTAHVAYVPDKHIIGVSKLARAVDIFARRLQDQERITMQVSQEIDELLKPKGVAVFLEAKHLCNMARGTKQTESIMKTLAFTGVFQDNCLLQERFLRMTR